MSYVVTDTKTATLYGGFRTMEEAVDFMRDRFDELYFYHYDPDGYHPQWNEENVMEAIFFIINGEEFSLSIEEETT